MSDLNSEDFKKDVPGHVAVIMDGNGRWALAQGLGRTAGHQHAISRVRELIVTASKCSIKTLTLFAFGRDNWRRPEDEVDFLMALFIQCLQEEVAELRENAVIIKIVGDRSRLGRQLIQLVEQAEQQTQNNRGTQLNIMMDYSGRWDLQQAAIRMSAISSAGELKEDQSIEQFLVTADMPEVDLLIRTSGEQRLSDFMLWQLAYAELYFTDVCFPDFSAEEFNKALLSYRERKRRFGRIDQQLSKEVGF